MVTIVNYRELKNSSDEPFMALVIQSGVEMVQSKETGKFYATAKKALVPSTFEEQVCRQLIGTKMPGSIKKVNCEPYEIQTDNGETLKMSHRHQYVPETKSERDMEEQVFGDLAEVTA